MCRSKPPQFSFEALSGRWLHRRYKAAQRLAISCGGVAARSTLPEPCNKSISRADRRCQLHCIVGRPWPSKRTLENSARNVSQRPAPRPAGRYAQDSDGRWTSHPRFTVRATDASDTAFFETPMCRSKPPQSSFEPHSGRWLPRRYKAGQRPGVELTAQPGAAVAPARAVTGSGPVKLQRIVKSAWMHLPHSCVLRLSNPGRGRLQREKPEKSRGSSRCSRMLDPRI